LFASEFLSFASECRISRSTGVAIVALDGSGHRVRTPASAQCILFLLTVVFFNSDYHSRQKGMVLPPRAVVRCQR
jgi:hypothetical protein